MFNSIKRLTKHSLIYGIGHIMSRFIGFLLLPIHTNMLPPEAYGTAALLFSSLAILNIIFSYGMDVAFLRFFALEENHQKKQTIFSTAFWMILGTGFVFSMILIFKPTLFSQWIFREPSFAILVRLAAGILLADALALVPFLVLRSEEKSIAFVTIKSANIVLNVVLNIIFIGLLKQGVTGVFYANLFASAATLVLLFPVCAHWFRFRFDKFVLSELLKFGLPYIPSGLAVVIMDQIGRFFLDRMAGKEATGLFSATYKLGMFMALVVAAFRFAWHPFFLATSKQPDAKAIFSRILTYFLIATGAFFLAITFFLDQIIHFQLFGFRLFGAGYEGGAPIVPIILLAYICYGVYINFIVGIYIEKKTGYLPFVTGLGALVSIACNFLLIPQFGIIGAAWASFAAYLAMAVSLYFVSHRFYPIQYEFKRVLLLGLIIGGIYWLGTHVVTHWILHVVLLLLIGPFLWAARFLHESEKIKIKQLLKIKP